MPSDQNQELNELRQQLRKVDDDLIEIVCRRIEVVRKIGIAKKLTGTPILDSKQEMLNKQKNFDLAAGRVPSDLIDDLTELLAKWSRDIQSVQP
jgi:chorismate mutase